jgi:hypothetical protein
VLSHHEFATLVLLNDGSDPTELTVRTRKRCSRIGWLRSGVLGPTTADVGSQPQVTLFFKPSGVFTEAIAERTRPLNERIALTRRECRRPCYVGFSYRRCWQRSRRRNLRSPHSRANVLSLDGSGGGPHQGDAR